MYVSSLLLRLLKYKKCCEFNKNNSKKEDMDVN
jgi:hypothetical protein